MGDCSFTMQNGLEIHAENGRDLWRNNLSAPRMLLQFSTNTIKDEGTYSVVQTVCTSVSREKPTIGGILLWKDKQNWLCLDRGVQGPHEISFWGCSGNEDLVFGRGRLTSD